MAILLPGTRSGRPVKLRDFVLLTALVGTTAMAAPPALADSLLGTPGNNWQSWRSATLTDQNGIPYWNNGSGDGAQMSVGFCLTAAGRCPQLGAGAPGAIPFWGALGGAADPSFFFHASGNSNAVLHLVIAGNAETNVFGWFETDATGAVIGATHPLFSGVTGQSSAEFSPTLYYGYYLTSTVHGATWYTLSSGNPSDETSDQHFAAFEGPDSYTFWIGAEDRPFSIADQDFNDFIIEVTTQGGSVPEADTWVLVTAGLVVLGACALGRRRNPPARER